MRPEVHYVRSDDVHIAYQVFGEGPLDIVVVPSWTSNLDHWWNHPLPVRLFRRLGAFGRVVLFDGRGIGLSDPVPGAPTLEERVDDVLAVMGAIGSERAALVGTSDAAAVSLLAAATYPERVEALVLHAGYASSSWHPDFPWGQRPEQRAAQVEEILGAWGADDARADVMMDLLAPSAVGDARFRDWWVSMARLAASPGRLRKIVEMSAELDVRSILSTIRVRTLVVHRRDDRAVPVENAHYLADKIPGAKLLVLEDADHLPFSGDIETFVDEVQEFLTGTRRLAEPDRVLATIMFTDIVTSTEHAAQLGDRRWRELLDEHDEVVRQQLERFRGNEVKTTGDGFVATFDGPARAIHCTRAIAAEAATLGIQIRAGLHTGECEMRGDDIGGIAVHVAARVLGAAGPGETVVSSTVKDLVAGSGIRFVDRGVHPLRGVPDEWHLFAVEG